MTSVAIVASKQDAAFAESLNRALKASGHDASVTGRLPAQSGSYVVLIWSAALDAAQAIDAQALIGLWSEGRLLLVRRDATQLPLGLRDLPSLPPDKTAEDVCSAVAKAIENEAKFMGVGRAAEGGRASPVGRILASVVVASIAIGGSAYYYLTAAQREKQATLTAALETATKASEELQRAKQEELEALKRLEAARAAEEAARNSGDAAALQTATAARLRAEADAAAQTALVRQREAAATGAIDAARKSSEDAKRAATVKSAPKVEVAAAAPKAEAPKAEPKSEPVAKAAPEAPKSAEPKAVAKSAPEAMSRSERERIDDEEAARKALAAAGKAPAQKTVVASVSAAAPAAEPGRSEHDTLYQQALAMEEAGNAKDAIRIYRRAARAGNGKAARRLGDIYQKGVPGVSRDYAESLQWYETARQLGEPVLTVGRGSGGSAPAAVAPKAEKAPPPAPAAPMPEEAKAAARAPAPPAEPKAALPPPAPEPGPPYGIILGLLLLVAVAVVLWRRDRRKEPQLEPAAAPAASQAPADATMLFVSYSHRDRPRVEPIVSLIESMGRRVWMDRTDITGKTGWAGQIVRAIRDCRAVVLMASPNSYRSDQVVRELYLAMNHKKTIVPIEIEPAELPDELQYILAPFQHHRLSGAETREVLGRALAAV